MRRQLIKGFNGRIVVTLAVPIALIAGAAFALSTRARAHDDDEAAVRNVLVESAAAFERSDLAALEKLWAGDESVTVFESGHANYGWADYRDHHLVPEMKELKNTKYSLSDVRVKVSGKTAWATFKYTISAEVEGRHIDSGGLGTAVLEERQGRWQIVHWHSSAPRRAPASANPPPAKKG